MDIVNFKPMFLKKLTDICSEHKDYSIGEVLYSFLRENALGVNLSCAKDLRGIKDEQFQKAIESAYEAEKEVLQ